MKTYLEKYQEWLDSPEVDSATKAELRQITDQEIRERFYKDLEFGTGGLRGVIAAGTNRMNVYTVRRAARGFVNYLLSCDEKAREKGIVIAYDSRHFSDVFALETAAVACAEGMKAYVFESLRPTPELSFAIRYLGCKGGVVLTASHNPSKYNGFKAYWEDGCQVPPPMDSEIIHEVMKVDLFGMVKTMEREEAEKKGLFISIGEEVDTAFRREVLNCLIDKEAARELGKDLKIIYTPLHGTGITCVPQALKEAGFTSVTVVPSQAAPDGDFPTAPYPNPEEPSVFEPGILLAEKEGADILIATDPDADRMGVMVKGRKGYRLFNGNMAGVLLLSYILEARKKTGNLPKDGYCVKTVVTTEMGRAVTDDYGVELKEVLTGFKYIGEQIGRSEKKGSGSYLFGFEESFGYLCGTYARDKDSVSAALLIAEMAAVYKAKGMTLEDALEELYRKYGYFKEELVSLTFEGISGVETIRKMVEDFRLQPKESYGGKKVLKVIDYSKGVGDLPKSNVLRFMLEDQCWFCARPSGTEPKIKFYFGVKAASEEEALQLVKALSGDVVPKQNV